MKNTYKFAFVISILLSVISFSSVKFLNPERGQKQRNAELRTASIEGDVKKVQQLIKQDVDIDETENGVNALILASQSNRREIAEILVNSGSNVNFKGVAGVTPLHVAAQYGSITIVQFLLKKGADVNAKKDGGLTVLDVAESVRRVRSRSSNKVQAPTVSTIDEIIRLLQQAGAKPGK